MIKQANAHNRKTIPGLNLMMFMHDDDLINHIKQNQKL